MSTPFHYSPTFPAVPNSTPLGALQARQGSKLTRPPIQNPFDKFSQNEFESWIGGITSALRKALGQEEESQRAPEPVTEKQIEELSYGFKDVDAGIEHDADESILEDSFADFKARRSTKGKGRDPREGPGLAGSEGWNKDQPIELLSDDDEEGEEPSNGDIYPGKRWEDIEGEDEDGRLSWDEDEYGSPSPERGAYTQPPPRGGWRESPERKEVFELDDDDGEYEEGRVYGRSGNVYDEVDEEFDEESNEGRHNDEAEEYDEDDYESERRSSPAAAEEEGAEEYDVETQFSPLTRLADDHEDDEIVEIRGSSLSDVQLSPDASLQYPDDDIDEIQPLANDTSFPPREVAEPEENIAIRDPWTGPQTYAEDFYSGGDRLVYGGRMDAHLLEEEIPGNSPLSEARDDGREGESAEKSPALYHSAFPPAVDDPAPLELPDVWEGPRNFAEDFYSGGDFKGGDNMALGPHQLEEDRERYHSPEVDEGDNMPVESKYETAPLIPVSEEPPHLPEASGHISPRLTFAQLNGTDDEDGIMEVLPPDQTELPDEMAEEMGYPESLDGAVKEAQEAGNTIEENLGQGPIEGQTVSGQASSPLLATCETGFTVAEAKVHVVDDAMVEDVSAASDTVEVPISNENGNAEPDIMPELTLGATDVIESTLANTKSHAEVEEIPEEEEAMLSQQWIPEQSADIEVVGGESLRECYMPVDEDAETTQEGPWYSVMEARSDAEEEITDEDADGELDADVEILSVSSGADIMEHAEQIEEPDESDWESVVESSVATQQDSEARDDDRAKEPSATAAQESVVSERKKVEEFPEQKQLASEEPAVPDAIQAHSNDASNGMPYKAETPLENEADAPSDKLDRVSRDSTPITAADIDAPVVIDPESSEFRLIHPTGDDAAVAPVSEDSRDDSIDSTSPHKGDSHLVAENAPPALTTRLPLDENATDAVNGENPHIEQHDQPHRDRQCPAQPNEDERSLSGLVMVEELASKSGFEHEETLRPGDQEPDTLPMVTEQEEESSKQELMAIDDRSVALDPEEAFIENMEGIRDEGSTPSSSLPAKAVEEPFSAPAPLLKPPVKGTSADSHHQPPISPAPQVRDLYSSSAPKSVPGGLYPDAYPASLSSPQTALPIGPSTFNTSQGVAYPFHGSIYPAPSASLSLAADQVALAPQPQPIAGLGSLEPTRDPFELMGSDKSVFPREVHNDGPDAGASSAERSESMTPISTSQSIKSTPVDSSRIQPIREIDVFDSVQEQSQDSAQASNTQIQTAATSTSAVTQSSSAQQASGSPTKPSAKRKRQSNLPKKKRKAKDKALDHDADTPLDGGEAIHVKPRTVAKGKAKDSASLSKVHRNAPQSSASVASGSSASSAARLLQPGNDTGSRASSVVSSVASDVRSQASPTVHTTVPTPTITHAQPPSLFHAHGAKRKQLQSLSFASAQNVLQGRGPSFSRLGDRSYPLSPTTPTTAHYDAAQHPTPTGGPARRSHTWTNSPVPITRSHCRFHKISIPKDDDGPRIYFIVPGCSLTKEEVLEEEEIIDHGDATYEDSQRMVPDVESLGFEDFLINSLRLLVGAEIFREREIFYLPLPGEEVVREKGPGQSFTPGQGALTALSTALKEDVEAVEGMSSGTDYEISDDDSDYNDKARVTKKARPLRSERTEFFKAGASTPTAAGHAHHPLHPTQTEPLPSVGLKSQKRPRPSVGHDGADGRPIKKPKAQPSGSAPVTSPAQAPPVSAPDSTQS